MKQALAPDFDVRCWVAMRYWNPLTAETAAAVRATPLDALVLLPLYPHYSFATTLSSLKEWKRVYQPAPGAPQATMIEEFHTHPLYIEALVKKSSTSLSHFDDPDKVHLVFSAHGLPLSLIERGDPYQRQVEETVRAVMARGGWRNAHMLCYQSRVGRQKWLEPSLSADASATGAGREEALTGDSDLLCHRAHRNAARDQYRSARGSHGRRRRAIRDDARGGRFAAVHRGAGGSGARRSADAQVSR